MNKFAGPAQQEFRELARQRPSPYKICWNKVPDKITKRLKKGTWLKKKDRCRLIRLIVEQVIDYNPKVERVYFGEVAKMMLAKYTKALHDRNGEETSCSFYASKLKCRFDEERRDASLRGKSAAPKIPEAHGCIQWRVPVEEQTRRAKNNTKAKLVQMFANTAKKDWQWKQILTDMNDCYGLQRKTLTVKPSLSEEAEETQDSLRCNQRPLFRLLKSGHIYSSLRECRGTLSG